MRNEPLDHMLLFGPPGLGKTTLSQIMATQMDVGIKIFTKLNISRGLPVPIVVRYDYHGNVPGARDRAVQHCQRVSDALDNRYQDLQSQGLLHTLMVAKDVNNSKPIEILGSSVSMQATQEAH